jgi:hypothetical protein
MPRGHYTRKPGWVNPLKGVPRPRAPLAVRYWVKVDKRGPDECWPWLGSFDTVGYGVIWGGGDSPLPAKFPKAHRVGLWLAGKEIPAGKVADHKCGNRWCQNPAHMEPETQADNCTLFADERSPFARNRKKTACKHGHPFADENLARLLLRRNRKGEWQPTRVCLTCFPAYANHPRRFWLPGEVPR